MQDVLRSYFRTLKTLKLVENVAYLWRVAQPNRIAANVFFLSPEAELYEFHSRFHRITATGIERIHKKL